MKYYNLGRQMGIGKGDCDVLYFCFVLKAPPLNCTMLGSSKKLGG